MTSLQERIEHKLTQALQPVYLEVLNESHAHNVSPGSESHFKVIIASARFTNTRLLVRHRLVNDALSEEIEKIHALAVHALTPDEWFERAGQTLSSPQCLGGERLAKGE